jgi:hypothetical protein
MKNSILLLLFSLFSLALFAQKKIYCVEREVCQWQESTPHKINCDKIKEISTFTLNKDESEIIHNTPEMRSVYTVNSSETIGAIKVFVVTSDAGNNYTFIWNEKKKEMKILAYFNAVITFKVTKVEK